MNRLFAAALFFATPATAAVLTFDEPSSGPVATFYNPLYVEGGLAFTTPYGEAVWKPGINQGVDNGTQYFINGYSALTITSATGRDFTFSGFDYGQALYSSNATDPLVVTLTLAGGGTQVLTALSTGVFQRLDTAPVKVSSIVIGATSGYFAIDNLTYSLVPEPAVWLSMLVGLIAVGSLSRRRRGAVTTTA
jgi:hypothetical protein